MDKAVLRRDVLARRAMLGDRDARSDLIQSRVRKLASLAGARVLASYVGVGPEVATIALIEEGLEQGKTVAVPWRDGNDLHLAWLTSLSELVPVSFGLLEPPRDLALAREVLPGDVDLMLIPGVAFDARGGRLGHGKGFYDRLLVRAGPGPLRVALAFDCQMVEEVPMVSGDERMDLIVTETAVHAVSARTALEAR